MTLPTQEIFLTAALSARLAGEPPTPGPDLVDLHRGLQLPDREVEGSGGALEPTESEDREDPQPKEEGQDVADCAAHSQGCPYQSHLFLLSFRIMRGSLSSDSELVCSKESTLIFVTTIRSLKHYTDKGVLRRISEDSLCYAFTDHPGKFPVASQKWRDFYEFSLATGLVPKQE